jgi:hypothetical protein
MFPSGCERDALRYPGGPPAGKKKTAAVDENPRMVQAQAAERERTGKCTLTLIPRCVTWSGTAEMVRRAWRAMGDLTLRPPASRSYIVPQEFRHVKRQGVNRLLCDSDTVSTQLNCAF